VESILNDALGFDEVRWATMRKTSPDFAESFHGTPRKTLLPAGTRLFRLVPFPTDRNFSSPWWMPEHVFLELQNDAAVSSHGGGRLLRNYVAQYMALPSGNYQLSVVEIELTRAVYAWLGEVEPLFGRPGGMEQAYLPNLADRGSPRTSSSARLVNTYWLRF
jgi:hypothetical protein